MKCSFNIFEWQAMDLNTKLRTTFDKGNLILKHEWNWTIQIFHVTSLWISISQYSRYLFTFLGNTTHSKVASKLSQLPSPFVQSHVARGHSLSRCEHVMRYKHVPLNTRLKEMQLQYFMESSKKLKIIQESELTRNHTSGRKWNISYQKKSEVS